MSKNEFWEKIIFEDRYLNLTEKETDMIIFIKLNDKVFAHTHTHLSVKQVRNQQNIFITY